MFVARVLVSFKDGSGFCSVCSIVLEFPSQDPSHAKGLFGWWPEVLWRCFKGSGCCVVGDFYAFSLFRGEMFLSHFYRSSFHLACHIVGKVSNRSALIPLFVSGRDISISTEAVSSDQKHSPCVVVFLYCSSTWCHQLTW